MNVCTSCAQGYRLSKETEASMDLVVQEANTLLTGCHPENRTKSTSQCLHKRKHPPDNTGLKHGAGYSFGILRQVEERTAVTSDAAGK